MDKGLTMQPTMSYKSYDIPMGRMVLKGRRAKGMSQTALKNGIDKFMYSTSSCVGKRMLLKTIANQFRMQINKEQETPIIQACISKRRLPHFCYQREDAANSLKLLNHKGHKQNPDNLIINN
jgi:hypothetical protein